MHRFYFPNSNTKQMDVNDYSDSQQPGPDYSEMQTPASPYGKGTKPPAKPAQPAKPPLKTPANGEVTILTSFPWNPPIDGKTEIQYLLNGKWHPSYPDYSEITGVTMTNTPGDFIALMGMIAEYKPGTIRRLNFFTHANKKVIGIAGYMDSSNVYFTTSVDETEIANYASSGMSFKYNGQDFTLDDVRARFTSDAIFVLYGCDTAFDPTTLLAAIKDLLQVTVVGFKDKTVFCPPSQTVDGTVFNRKGETMGVYKSGFKCGTDSKADWRSLITDPNAVTVKK
jgi:hypothetical protein